MTEEGSAKIVNLMTPGAGDLMLGHDYISHYSVYALSSTLSLYGTWIAIVLRDYRTCFPMLLLIYIYSMMGLLIRKYQSFWQEVSVESLILGWLLRPIGLLYKSMIYVIYSVFITVHYSGRREFERIDTNRKYSRYATEKRTYWVNQGLGGS